MTAWLYYCVSRSSRLNLLSPDTIGNRHPGKTYAVSEGCYKNFYENFKGQDFIPTINIICGWGGGGDFQHFCWPAHLLRRGLFFFLLPTFNSPHPPLAFARFSSFFGHLGSLRGGRPQVFLIA